MLITTAKHCSVNQFMEAQYENNLTILGEGTPEEQQAALQNIYIEYCELAGAEMPELPLMTSIHNTKIRITAMDALLAVHRMYVETFGAPKLDRIAMFEPYNHKVTYSGDNDAFLQQLSVIEKKERKYRMRLAEDEQKLENMRIANNTKHSPLGQNRIAFVDMLIQLGDTKRHPIDLDKTTMEMLGIMVQRHNKEAQTAKKN